MEVSSEREYGNIVWNRGGVTLDSNSVAPAKLSEFVHFLKIFVREPTSTSDYGLYDIFYSGAGGLGTTIAVVSPGKLIFHFMTIKLIYTSLLVMCLSTNGERA